MGKALWRFPLEEKLEAHLKKRMRGFSKGLRGKKFSLCMQKSKSPLPALDLHSRFGERGLFSKSGEPGWGRRSSRRSSENEQFLSKS